ncbi:hypothetical protein ACFSMW_16085 [Virgibacillus halophilus]|uniref:Lipoprotein n=1 Tax=Tigheibacillus halophilus TaxID=361280 RepID=A0ABU5C3T5_9BACI|nr:hypothetical protein [Virgibacillus halophilus]
MSKTLKALAIIVLLTIVGCGCSNSINRSVEKTNGGKTTTHFFTGTIKEINGDHALVHAELGGGKGDILVDLSVNSDKTFQIRDEIKVAYDGTIKESNPAQINTLTVDLAD